MRTYTGRREYVERYETYIYRGEVEIPLDLELEVYQGSHTDDDPTEIIINRATVAEDNYPYVKGQRLVLSAKEEELISDRYFKNP